MRNNKGHLKAAGFVLCGVSILACLSACSSRDFGRVSGPRLLRVPPPAASTNAVQTRNDVELAGALAAWQLKHGASAAERYAVGPADVLKIGVFGLEEPDRNSVMIRPVAEDGTINLPLVDDIHVAGMDDRQIQKTVKEAYLGKYLKDPQVSVSVEEFKSRPIVLSGAVMKPGMYYLRGNSGNVLEILSEAGGIRADAGDSLYIIRSRSADGAPPGNAGSNEDSAAGEQAQPHTRKLVVDLKLLLERGDLSQNSPIKAGDAVVVPMLRAQYVYVIGYVLRQGAINLREGDKLGVVQAVTLAGGFADAAKPDKSFILRETPQGQQIIPVQVAKIARAEKPPVYMEAGDTLIVPSSTVGKLMEIVRPSVGVGMQYSPVP